jgi:putative aldouronate transport system substrate-binding protein
MVIRKTGMFLLIAAMVLTLLAGCSGNNGNGNTASTPDTSKTPANTNTDKGSEPAKDEVVELDLFIDHSWWPVKEWSGSVPEEITKRTGVKLNIMVATDDKQLPLMIASGDLPDLIFTSANAQRLSDPALAHAWDDLIKEHAPDFQPHPEKIAVNLAPDGKYYTIRNNFSPGEEWKANEGYALQGGADVGFRKDIYEALGSPPINTLDDFDNLLGMVKAKYPDMVPLVLNPTDTWYMGFFANNYGVWPKGFYEDNGELKYGLRQPELLDMYKYMNQLYRKGYILPENYAFKNEDQAKELVTNGRGFAYVWTSGVADRLNSDTKGNDKGIVFTQVGKPLSDQAKITRSDTGWSGVVISKKNKHPEKSIKLMQFLMSQEGQRLSMWGIEGTHYKMHPDGYPEFLFDKNSADVQNKEGSYWWGLLAGTAVTEALYTYVPGSETTEANVNWTKIMDWKPELGLVKAEPDSSEQVIITNLENMIKNEGSKVLLAPSEADAEKAFNNMVEQAEKMGMAKLEAWANEEYKQIKAIFGK